MQSLRANNFLLVSAVAVLVCAAGSILTISATGGRCTSKACTYFDANGTGFTGTCGSKKGDKKNCYCVVNENKELSQVQSGCSASR